MIDSFRPRRRLAAMLFAVIAVPASAGAQACQGVPGGGRVQLSVAAAEVRSAKGDLVFTVYPDDRRRFLAKGGKLVRARVPARGGTTSACFWLAPGHYAVATYHDENGDHDFNRTLFSVKEGFGFSNDARTTLGIPKFEAARFDLGANGGTIRVRTRYPG